MNKKKTLDELLTSIYSLINEAQDNYQNILSNDLKEIQKNRINKESEFLSKNKVIEKITHEETQEDSVKTTQKNEITTWDKINFKNNFSFTYNSKKNISNLDSKRKEFITSRFNMILSSWAEKNLKKIVETEFSNHIQKK